MHSVNPFMLIHLRNDRFLFRVNGYKAGHLHTDQFGFLYGVNHYAGKLSDAYCCSIRMMGP